MANTNPVQPVERSGRFWMVVGMTVLSVLGVTTLAIVIIATSASGEKSATAQLVLTAVLPLLGSWVGTILAFYFSRENLEAATNSVTQLANLTPMQKLQSLPVTSKWITTDKMFRKSTPLDGIKLVPTLSELNASGKGNRLPVLSDKNYPALVVHRSWIDRFLTKKATQDLPPDQFKLLTLQDLVDDPTANSCW